MSGRRMTFEGASRPISGDRSQRGQVRSTSKSGPVVLRSYVAIEEEAGARKLELYFKSGSGKAFAKKRFLGKPGSV